MDANTLLNKIDQAVRDQDKEAEITYCSSLCEWLVRGGTTPKWTRHARAHKAMHTYLKRLIATILYYSGGAK